jgi:uncharacterized protein YkwD
MFMRVVFLCSLAFISGCETDDLDTTGPQNVCEYSQYQSDFIHRVNQARNTPRFCGEAYFVSAPPVRFSCKIEPAAEVHSLDMAYRGFASHIGSNGVGLEGRLSETSYDYSYVGEALAVNGGDLESAFEAMMDDPRYCGVIMDFGFKDAAVVRIDDSAPELSAFWTLVMASPR